MAICFNTRLMSPVTVKICMCSVGVVITSATCVDSMSTGHVVTQATHDFKTDGVCTLQGSVAYQVTKCTQSCHVSVDGCCNAAACEALMMCRRDNPNMKHLMQGAYTWYAPDQTAFGLASVSLTCAQLVSASMNQVLSCDWWFVQLSALVLEIGKEQLRHQPLFPIHPALAHKA